MYLSTKEAYGFEISPSMSVIGEVIACPNTQHFRLVPASHVTGRKEGDVDKHMSTMWNYILVLSLHCGLFSHFYRICKVVWKFKVKAYASFHNDLYHHRSRQRDMSQLFPPRSKRKKKQDHKRLHYFNITKQYIHIWELNVASWGCSWTKKKSHKSLFFLLMLWFGADS